MPPNYPNNNYQANAEPVPTQPVAPAPHLSRMPRYYDFRSSYPGSSILGLIRGETTPRPSPLMAPKSTSSPTSPRSSKVTKPAKSHLLGGGYTFSYFF